MNYYVVVEGERTEIEVYSKWITYVNPLLTQVYNNDDFTENNFSLFAGFGYPYYFNVIDDAIEDVKNYSAIDKLVIAVDSEDQTYKEKFDEIYNY